MMKTATVLALGLSTLAAGCTFKGFRLPPDASLSWELCNAKKLYPIVFMRPDDPSYNSQEYSKAFDEFFKRKQGDMLSCGYNPIAGGGREADACVRKKGWYRSRMDIYPENKIYEQCQHD